MVDYEVIHEILNLCPGNQMRDVFIEEIQLPENADLEEYVREKFKNEGELKIDRTDRADGTRNVRFPGFNGFSVAFSERFDIMEEVRERRAQNMEETRQEHTHVLEDGTVVVHHHGHTHSHTHTKAVLNRLSRAIGHMESIRRMVEEGRDCSEVLIQLSAVKAAINNTGKVILQDHIEHCIVDAIESGDHEALEELNKAIDRFMK